MYENKVHNKLIEGRTSNLNLTQLFYRSFVLLIYSNFLRMSIQLYPLLRNKAIQKSHPYLQIHCEPLENPVIHDQLNLKFLLKH